MRRGGCGGTHCVCEEGRMLWRVRMWRSSEEGRMWRNALRALGAVRRGGCEWCGGGGLWRRRRGSRPWS